MQDVLGGPIWINHHELFTRVRRVDDRAPALNLLVLLAASLLPWPAAVVGAAVRQGDRHDQALAMTVYAAVDLLIPLAFATLYTYLAHVPQLLTGPSDVTYCHQMARRGFVSAIAFFPVAALAALFTPIAALVIFVTVPTIFLGALLLPEPTQ